MEGTALLLPAEESSVLCCIGLMEKGKNINKSKYWKISIICILICLSLREESVDARPALAALANPFGSGEEDRRWMTHDDDDVLLLCMQLILNYEFALYCFLKKRKIGAVLSLCAQT